jgi:hypothetical protein
MVSCVVFEFPLPLRMLIASKSDKAEKFLLGSTSSSVMLFRALDLGNGMGLTVHEGS